MLLNTVKLRATNRDNKESGMFELDDNVAIVTGAASEKGIGKAVAAALAQQGARVVVCDVDYEGVKKVVRAIGDAGGEASAFKADVSSSKDVKNTVDETMALYGKVDILVNNAGINQDVRVVDMKETDWERVLAVNLKSVFLFCRAVLPSMIERGYGRIINMSSVAGKSGCLVWGGAHYSASKGGILAFSKHLVREASPHGVTVNCLTPGAIATDIRGGLEPESQQSEISNKIPVGRFGSTGEVAATICFLASREAGYITGEEIDINGGFFMD